MNPSPVHLHDCRKCQHLATVRDVEEDNAWVDIYQCKSGALGPSIVARWGSQGPQYTSSPASMVKAGKCSDYLVIGKMLL